MMWTVWWVWLVAAAALGAVELVMPGFIFLGFAIGAALVGLLLLTGLLGGGFAFLILVFAVLSLIAWLVLRATLSNHDGQVKRWTKDIND